MTPLKVGSKPDRQCGEFSHPENGRGEESGGRKEWVMISATTKHQNHHSREIGNPQQYVPDAESDTA
jgi:hypothetical protein